MDVDDEDELNEVCKRHFEEAMKFARRSVSDQVIKIMFIIKSLVINVVYQFHF